MKCFYHNDLDGRCAGAIVWRIEGKVRNCEMIELDYKDEINIEDIQKDELVFIVDFSFIPEIMEKVLLKTINIHWIDHHKTAFEYKYSQELKGLRNNAFSGCELTWKYLVPRAPMPRAVELIGDRDKWAWKFGEETAKFNQGIKIFSHQPQDKIWERLLTINDYIEIFADIMQAGIYCLEFRNSFCKDYADSYGFETEFEGHKCFALGLYMFGSEAFGERFKQYDICLSFEFSGKNWIIGLYSKTVDVSVIAKKYGGGGHKGAAGFVCKELPISLK